MNPTVQKILAGMLSGLLPAVAIDYQNFKKWKSFDEARKYNWGVAIWKWFQGAVGGAVVGAGLSPFLT